MIGRMASALYVARCLSVEGAKVVIELSIVHPDIAEFGTDRLFAWKLLHEWVSPADDGTEVELASRYVKSVKLAPLRHAKKAQVANDFYTVKRTGDEHPTVTYTITVTDPELVSGIKAGDCDEVYDYVEPGKGAALTDPPSARKPQASPSKDAASGARKSKPQAALVIPNKTFDDLRMLALEQIGKFSGSWSDYVLEHGMIEHWAETESDARMQSFLDYLTINHRVGGATQVAIARLRSGQLESAKALLSYAEALHDPSLDYNYSGRGGLAALWWRLHEDAKADALFQEITKAQRTQGTNHNQAVHTQFTILARGARWDRAAQLIPSLLKDGSYRDDLLVPGVVVAWEDSPSLFAKVMDHWQDVSTRSHCQNHELSYELCRRMLRRGKPEEYLDAVLRWYGVLDDGTSAVCALLHTEARDPQRAIPYAQKLLHHPELGSYVQQYSLAVLARHVPAQAESFVTDKLPSFQERGYGHAYLAAAGMTTMLQELTQLHPMRDPASVARLLSDRTGAIALLKQAVSQSHSLGGIGLIDLVDLGERSYVDELLRKELARLAAEPTRNRDLSCRALATSAAQVGMPEHGFAAIKLPGPALRRYSASDMTRGAASVRDYGAAYAALQLVPDGDSNGRVSTAIQGVLRVELSRSVDGPRAIPLAVCDLDYARALAKVGERDAVAWMLSAYRNRLSDSDRKTLRTLVEE